MSYQKTKVDDFIFRGPAPTLEDMRDCVIAATLDLEGGRFGDGSPLNECAWAKTIGIRVYPHPLGVFLPPTAQELVDGAAFLASQKRKGIPTLVHCLKGVDRTGMICAAYRIRYQYWPVRAAVYEMIAMGFHLWYFYWIPQLWRIK